MNFRSFFRALAALPRASLGVRLALAWGCLLLASGAVAWSFWRSELQYARPTPRPAALVQPPTGVRIELGPISPKVAQTIAGATLTLLHFYNADCPCSRFNADHLRSLHTKYGGKVRFVGILESEEPATTEALEAAQQRLGRIEVVWDEGGRLAAACGVYSTPQAVVFSSRQELLYRGNYNSSRYCVDPANEFARLVLTHLLQGEPVPALPDSATRAYGCELPAAHPAS